MDSDLARGGTFSSGDTPQDSCVPPPVDLNAWLRRWKTPVAAGSSQREKTASPVQPRIRERDRSARRLERAASYLRRVPAAISGQGGHNRTFHAACVLIKGFALSIDEARPLLREWNERRTPPWSEAELEHKLKKRPGCPGQAPWRILAPGTPGTLDADRGAFTSTSVRSPRTISSSNPPRSVPRSLPGRAGSQSPSAGGSLPERAFFGGDGNLPAILARGVS